MTHRSMIRRITMALALGSLTLSAAACNTVRGAGQDLESVANDVDKAI